MLSKIVSLLLAAAAVCAQSQDEPFGNPHPQVTLPNKDVVHGKMDLFVETFKGIPFAQAPVGDLRFKPPVPFNGSLDGFNATEFGDFCISMSETSGFNISSIPPDDLASLSSLLTSLSGGSFVPGGPGNSSENCLSVNVFRPWTSMTKKSKLPVMVWIYGGAFESGSANQFALNRHVIYSMIMDQPIVAVSLNYRVGAYGFLGGKQIQNEGSANAGLLDQRQALKWVADNIESFGGDPDNVTIFGESAGSISVAHQMILYDGDNTYKGKPLFHGAIMQSGVAIPVEDIESSYPQLIFENLVSKAGCEGEQDSLACLRSRPSQNLTASENLLPGVFSYSTLKLSFMPRPDGKVVTNNTFHLLDQGKFAKIPFIVGNQEDEGTLFSVPILNITDTEETEGYLDFIFGSNRNESLISEMLGLYPQDPSVGSPYRTGDYAQLTPEFKRISSFMGDLVFQASRRKILQKANELDIPAWSFQASTNYNDTVLGTMHGSDIFWAFNGDYNSNPTLSYLKYFISFANKKDPNNVNGELPDWPKYNSGPGLVLLNISLEENSLLNDTYRQKPMQTILDNIYDLLI